MCRFYKTLPLILLFCLTACQHKTVDVERKFTKATAFVTTADGKTLLSQQPDITFADGASGTEGEAESNDTSGKRAPADNTLAFEIKNEKNQQMDGFGASMTDSSAYLIMKVMNEEQRNALMEELFSYENGIGISFLKQPMGTCDYALKLYTYDDLDAFDTDLNLEKFSIEYDKEHIIPALKLAFRYNPDLNILAMPWSPPAWMKTNQSLFNGMVYQKYYPQLSRYFIKFIESYEKEGIPIFAVSPQGEPLRKSDENPGCFMPADFQGKFIKENLGPDLEQAYPDVKIMALSHNWDTPEYVTTVYEMAGEYVDGASWHSYAGRGDTMVTMQHLYPDKGNWFTESSGGDWIPQFGPAFHDQMMHITRTVSQGAKSVVWWNLALDENRGPSLLPEGTSTCRGLVEINSETGEVTRNVDYYTIAHISKFVRVGAYRLTASSYKGNVESSAFENPDGSIVLILHNWNKFGCNITATYKDYSFSYTLPAESGVTFVLD